MLTDQAGHLEHRDLRLAEHSLELVVRIDHALVDFVLQTFGFDVNPEFADNFSAWQRLVGRRCWSGSASSMLCIGKFFPLDVELHFQHLNPNGASLPIRRP